MSTSSSNEVIVQLRTHPKILFGPFVCELVLIAAHVLVTMYWPRLTGWGWDAFDQWSALIVHAVLLIFNIGLAVVPVLRWWAGTFTLTNTSISQQWGIIAKDSREIPLNRITSVRTQRGLLDRIFGCGTLVFQDASATSSDGTYMSRPGGGGSGIRFHDVPHVLAVYDVIQNAREEA